jgi:hypothetical protein
MDRKSKVNNKDGINNTDRIKSLAKSEKSICTIKGTEDSFCIQKRKVGKLIKSIPNKKNITNIRDLLDETRCESAECLTTKLNLDKNRSRTIRMNMKPQGDINGNTWLDSGQITHILDNFKTQINEKFFNMGFGTVDFIKPTCDYKEFNRLKNVTLNGLIKNGYSTAGAVINTDECNGRGIHWFVLFIDLRNEDEIRLEYYNSVNNEMPDNICNFFKKLKSEYEESNTKKRRVKICSMLPHNHQKENSECGVYSLYYIRSRLDGISGDDIIKSELSDDVVHEFRSVIFAPKD